MVRLPVVLRANVAVFLSMLGLYGRASQAGAQTTRSGEPAGDVTQAYLRECYTKYEYMIPMRDGVKLFTAVFVPKDQSQRYPILLTRTPYSVKPYGVDVYPEPRGSLQYARERFIFAMQDVRGRYASEGQFVDMRPHRPADAGPRDVDESSDTYDTIDWLVKNLSDNSGRVGIMGISYPGFYTAEGMIDSHPALKCASPQAPMADLFVGDDTFHNGMLDDQRFAASRPDVLVYQSDVLQEDITIAGPVAPRLRVSTSGTDSDWVVKLIDVYPGDYPNPEPNPTGVVMGGYQQLVRGDIIRGKFRDSLENPSPFDLGKVTGVDYMMPDVNHAFRRGHRIMVQVQSSWFPLIDRNPQTFCDIFHAGPEAFQKATQRVYHSPDMPSHVVIRGLD